MHPAEIKVAAYRLLSVSLFMIVVTLLCILSVNQIVGRCMDWAGHETNRDENVEWPDPRPRFPPPVLLDPLSPFPDGSRDEPRFREPPEPFRRDFRGDRISRSKGNI